MSPMCLCGYFSSLKVYWNFKFCYGNVLVQTTNLQIKTKTGKKMNTFRIKLKLSGHFLVRKYL